MTLGIRNNGKADKQVSCFFFLPQRSKVNIVNSPDTLIKQIAEKIANEIFNIFLTMLKQILIRKSGNIGLSSLTETL